MKKKRILFITGRLGNGGAERRTLYLIKASLEYNLDVSLVVQRLGGSYMPLLPSRCRVYKLLGSFRLFGLGWLIRLMNLIFLLYKVRPNVIYTNLWGTAFLANQSLRFYPKGTKLVFGISSTIESFTERRLQFEKMLKKEDVILILQTERIKQKVLEYRRSGERVYVIPNVIDPAIVEAEVDDLEMNVSNVHKLIHVGRFVHVKRHDRLLEIAEKLKDRGIVFQLDVIGDGPLKTEISKMAREMGLDDTVVVFRGYQSNPLWWIAQADVMLLTSDYEGMPMVLIEALICGTPVVSTDVEFGPKEIVENSINGFLTPANAIEDFVDCIIAILGKKREFSERAKESSKRFYIQNHIEKYLDIFGVN